jgi:hypothetical protein
MRISKEAIAAVLIAGFGIILGNTVADFTNDFDSAIFSGGGSTPTVTFTCTPSP